MTSVAASLAFVFAVASPQDGSSTQSGAPSAAPAVPASATSTGLGFKLFPPEPMELAPSLASINVLPDSLQQPGALLPSDPLSAAAPEVKSALAKVGLTYQLDQAFLLCAMSNRVQGDAVLSAYNFTLWANWAIFRSDELGGTTGWISTEFGGGTGFGFDWGTQSPQSNLGTASAPYYEWDGNDLSVAEMAWAQSFAAGQLVVMLGMIDQTNSFDLNAYAGNAYGQLMNEAFVESQVLPMPGQGLGATVQWQPVEWLYALFGVGANNLPLGRAPWHDVSASDVSYLLELGLVSKDVLGLGPGTARIQPFVATVDGETGGGVALNVEQRLGKESPFGAFGRFGVGDETTAAVRGASAQAAGGIAMIAPFLRSGMFSADNNDYVGLGLKWTEAAGSGPVIHEDEYALELTASFQLTPTMTIQPDVQFIWDPAYSPESNAFVFQLALNIAW